MINVHAIVQLLTALSRLRSPDLRVYNCPQTVGRLSRAGIIVTGKIHRKRDHVWKQRGPEMNGGRPHNRGYTAFIKPGPNFEAALNGISALLAALPAKHDPCDRSYCDT